MWEVDPETKSKLLAIQKTNGNDRCCDCGAPSPQWASPKFSTFICLTCAGTHRSLGVHISFIRSISMDAFKPAELARMALGGNRPWREFWEAHPTGRRWEDTGIEARYSGEVGEEWKGRLSARVEGRDWVPVVKTTAAGPGRASPALSLGGAGPSDRKAANESFFARKGDENATRPSDLAPSLGGKYAGFGSAVPARSGGENAEGRLPGVDAFQQDPVAALTKGLGWFAGAVGKGARSVNEGWIVPVALKVASADLTTSARLTAAQVAQTVQTGTKGAAEHFSRFVEGEGAGAGARVQGEVGGAKGAGSSGLELELEPEKREFWDSFGANAATGGKSGAIGTAVVRKAGAGRVGTGAGAGTGVGGVGGGMTRGKGAGAHKEEGWGEDGWEGF